MNLKGKKILIGVSGGIAAYKICGLVRLFVKSGAEVRVIMTPAAVNFVSPAALSALSRNEVAINIFPEVSSWQSSETVDTGTWHVNYGLWCDLFIVAPATCNTIAKSAAGICDNLLLASLYSCRSPVLFAPAMDDDMYKYSATKRNLSLLRDSGFHVMDAEFGELASGLTGEGRMPEPEKIFEVSCRILAGRSDLAGKKILISAGPTREYIDRVRFITNPSTGKMGFELARAARERGAIVTLVAGPVTLDTPAGVKRIDVETAEEMFNAMKANRRNKDLIIMSAAVEDFTPARRAEFKIKKEDDKGFVFEFRKVPDILKYLGENKTGYKLIGFAVETNDEIANARKKLSSKNLDMIVLNNPDEEGAGFGADTNVVTLISKKIQEKLPKMTKLEVADRIYDKYLKMK